MSEAPAMERAERDVVVASAAGLHARPAAVVVQAARTLSVPVTISKGDRGPVNARSILRVINLQAHQGDTVRVAAEGPGAVAAVAHIAGLIATELDDDAGTEVALS